MHLNILTVTTDFFDVKWNFDGFRENLSQTKAASNWLQIKVMLKACQVNAGFYNITILHHFQTRQKHSFLFATNVVQTLIVTYSESCQR